MTDFRTTILKAISDYKVILRKNLPARQCTEKLHGLGIKRNYVKDIDDIGLHDIGLKIIEDLKRYLNSCSGAKTVNFYSGAKEFFDYLQGIYKEYYVEDDRVVHIGQKTSCALLSAIQLIKTPNKNLTGDIIQQIKQHGEVVAKYGSQEQKQMFIEAIGAREDSLAGYFSELL